MDNNSFYINSAWKTLSAELGNLLPQEDKNLTEGVHLLTEIALDAIKENDLHPQDMDLTLSFEPSEEVLFSDESEKSERKTELTDIEKRIDSFVKTNAYRFLHIATSGFSFSQFEKATTKQVLKNALHYNQSIFFELLSRDASSWLTEKSLDELYEKSLKLLKSEEQEKVCIQLKNQYIQHNDKRAGFYLLWMIKKLTKCHFELPPWENFNHKSVNNTLSFLVAQEMHLISHPILFIEFLCAIGQANSFLYIGILSEKEQEKFFNYVIEQLRDRPCKEWSNKFKIILNLMEFENSLNKKKLAMTFSQSADRKTAEIGDHLTAALKAETLREALPHYDALRERIPNLSDSHLESIFGRPLIKFAYRDKSLDFIRKLNFSNTHEPYVDSQNLFVYGSTMIGVSQKNSTIPPYLMAYNIENEKLRKSFLAVIMEKSSCCQKR